MHWGHATSKDLFRWKEEGVALYPKKYGDWAFSGSAVLDKENTSGWGTKEKPPLVLAYTSTGRGECIAYSLDNGKTWKEYDQNPVVKHTGRDPKLIWHAKAKHWVMAVYDEFQGKQWIAFHTSPDLKTWTFASRIEGFFECPDLFELPVNEVGEERSKVGALRGRREVPARRLRRQGVQAGLQGEEATLVRELLRGTNLRQRAANSYSGTTTVHPIGVSQHPPGANRMGDAGCHVPWNAVQPADDGAGGARALASRRRRGKYATDSPARSTNSPRLRDGKPVFVVPITRTRMISERLVLADNLDAFDLEIAISDKIGFTLDLRGTKLVYDAAKRTLTCKGVTAQLSKNAIANRFTFEFWWIADRWKCSRTTVFRVQSRHVRRRHPGREEPQDRTDPKGGEITVGGATVYRMKSAWGK